MIAARTTLAAMNTPTVTVPRRRAAALIGISAGTLKNWGLATPPRGPAAVKTTTSPQGRTLYRLHEIEQWQRDPAGYEARRNRSSHRGSRN